MSTTTILYLSGKPVSCPRPRATRQGGVYMPKKYMDEKNRLVSEVQIQAKMQNHVIIDEKCKVIIDFFFPATNKCKIKKGDLYSSPVYKETKPDIDNLIKTVLDVLTEAQIWTDDNIVVSITARKWYSGHPLGQTHVKIDLLGGDNE